MHIKSVNLHHILREKHPEFLIEGQSGPERNFIIFRLGFNDYDEETLLTCLKDSFGFYNEEVAYIIIMESIDIVSPSAANALVAGAVGIAQQRGVPIIFTEVCAEALRGLQTIRNLRQSEKVLWAVDVHGQPDFVGTVPDRFKGILKMLKEKDGASASDLAEANGEHSKKGINKFSVYLQELYNAGLVIREKVIGSDRADRADGERGWTYIYRPAYSVLTSLSSF